MDFYSIEFFTFFFIVLTVFFLCPQRFRWFVLLFASYYFYGSFKVQYIALLAFSTLIAYFTALGMQRHPEKPKRIIFLLLSLFCNIGILFLFKYYDFLTNSIQQLLGSCNIPYKGHTLNLIVPLGISFYVFQVVSYSIDVYRGEKTPEKHLGIFALYVAFFPKLLAGPIERAKQLIPQLHENSRIDWARITNGLKLMTWGLFKKVVIADRLAAFVNVVYADPSAYQGISLVVAVVFYSFQIYCDFSGYTDIAIGIAQVFGLRLTDNFARPYAAASVAEFWRRWHISLTSWLRDYLYIPLGGNRVKTARLYLNYIVVFFICGLWHGASWTFAVWGLIHGLYLTFGISLRGFREKFTSIIGLNRFPALHRSIQIITTFTLISLAWIFFRANTISDALYIISHLHVGWGKVFNFETLSSMILLTRSTTEFLIAISVLLFFGVVHFTEKHTNMRQMFAGKPLWLRFAVYYIMVTGILLLSLPGAQKFIYFQF
jgi:Predicted membrane protein involved in D-alanine export